MFCAALLKGFDFSKFCMREDGRRIQKWTRHRLSRDIYDIPYVLATISPRDDRMSYVSSVAKSRQTQNLGDIKSHTKGV